ncbi:MAG: DUF177 domain-containing protein [Desulfobulbaceae bacterium]|nr:DUF177 domain-containing protein [Desulfobulbaceae bacterium]
MKLHFDDIGAQPIRLTVEDNSWLPSDAELDVTAVAKITVSRRNNENIVLRGELKGKYFSRCGRCGADVKSDLQSSFEYIVILGEEEIPELQDVECIEQDVNTFYVREPEIDVDGILMEQAYLDLPLRVLCSDNCRGICAGCGVNLNRETCDCSKDNSGSPFAILSKLKK